MRGGRRELKPCGLSPCRPNSLLPVFVLPTPVWLGCGQREHHPSHLIVSVTIGHVGSLAWDLWELEAISQGEDRNLEGGGRRSGWDLQDPRQVGSLTLLCLRSPRPWAHGCQGV